jgi:hypothetical protein
MYVCTVFTRSHHWSLSWAGWIHSTSSYPISLRSILTSFLLLVVLLSGLFPQFSHRNYVCNSLSCVTCLAHLYIFDLIILTVFNEWYNLWSSSLCNFLQSPITSSCLHQIIHISTLLSCVLSLYSSLNVTVSVSHPCKTAGKIIALQF